MNRSHYRYPVRLGEEQRKLLEVMVHTSKTPAKHYLVVPVLLMSDQRQGVPEATDGQIAEALSISRRTVIRIKQRFVQENLEVALTESFSLRSVSTSTGQRPHRTIGDPLHSQTRFMAQYRRD